MDAAREAAAAIAAKLRGRSAEIEQARRMPADLVGAMVDAGLFRICVARGLGGSERDPMTLIDVVEEVAAADAAAGWVLMIGATTGVINARLSDPWAERIFGDPAVVTGGVLAPKGEVAAVDGGYRVSGRWPFASGCQHCDWLVGGSMIPGPDGNPALRLMVLPAADVEIVDTWHVAGLAGTGSHDIAVHDAFVPTELAVTLDGPALRGGPLFQFPLFGLLAVGVAAVALGIGRAAVDELTELAGAKTPTMTRRTLAQRSLVQLEVARATATMGGARSGLLGAVSEAWEAARAGREIALVDRARIRAAACHVTESAVRVVDAMYTAGGGTSIYATSPLQRHLRDVHVVTQHAMVGPTAYETAGRVLLGLTSDTGLL